MRCLNCGKDISLAPRTPIGTCLGCIRPDPEHFYPFYRKLVRHRADLKAGGGRRERALREAGQ